MPEIELVHCADGHLGALSAYLGERGAQRQTEVLRTFERVLDLCRTREVPLLLIAGDLFDRALPDAALRRAVMEGLGSLPKTRVFLAAGNHDPACTGSPYREALPERVHCFGRRFSCVEPDDLPVRVWGASFSGAYCDETELPKAIPDGRLNLLVLHGDLTASSRYRPITPAALAATGMDYVALGHVHSCSGVQTAGGVPYAYSGCFEGQGFDEAGEKGVLIGKISPGRADLSFLPMADRMHFDLSVDLEGAASNEAAEATIKAAMQRAGGAEFARHLYRLTLRGRAAAELRLDLLESKLNDAAYFVRLHDELAPPLDLEAAAAEPSLRGMFVRKMREKMTGATRDEEETLRLALRLGLEALEPDGEVAYRAD